MSYYEVLPCQTFGFERGGTFRPQRELGFVYTAVRLLKELSSGSDNYRQEQPIFPERSLVQKQLAPKYTNWLQSIKGLKHNWNGYGSSAPNSVALRAAEDALYALHRYGMKPMLVEASAEDGVGITIKKGPTEAVVECYNDGEIAVVIQENGNIKFIKESVSNTQSIEEVISDVYEYLG